MNIVALRRSVALAALVIGLAPRGALAVDLSPDSRIEAVTVYPDAAIVTRIAEVDLPPGESRLNFGGLPLSLDPASVRLEGAAEAQATLGSLDLGLAPSNDKAQTDAIEAKLTALREERDALQTNIDSLQMERAMIQRFAQTGPEKLSADSKPLDVQAWSAAWDAVRTGSAKVGEALRPALSKARELDAEIKGLEASRQRGPREAAKRKAVVSIATPAATHATIKLSYRIGGASWTPVYDAALKTTGEAASLVWTRRAAIAQTTGEDWGDVALTVSTARIARAVAVANVETAHVDFLAPPVVYSKAESTAGARAKLAAPRAADEAVPAAEAAPAPPPQKPAVEAAAKLAANGYDAQFKVEGRVALPSDGTQKSFALGTWTTKPTLALRTAPAFDPTAYIEARFAGADEAPILPGAVALTRDGDFIGNVDVGFFAPGDLVNLGFGADDKVRVQRAPVNRKENDPTWLNQSKVETREYRTAIKNLHAFPVKIQVIDQMPVSENTAIVIDPLPGVTPPTEKQIEDKRGVLGWTLDIPAGETREVKFGFRMKWPADRDISVDGAPWPMAR